MKLDDELYDYWGRCYRTHEDYECTDIMVEVMEDFINEGENIFLNEDNQKNVWITAEVEDVLIEYAPKLFSTLPSSKDLTRSMKGLAEEVNRWCNGNIVNAWKKEQIDNTYTMHKKKSTPGKAEALRNHIVGIYGLVGEKHIPVEVKEYLNNLSENAEEHVVPKSYFIEVVDGKVYQTEKFGFISTDRNIHPIKSYLKALNLIGKSKMIENFIYALSSIKPS